MRGFVSVWVAGCLAMALPAVAGSPPAGETCATAIDLVGGLPVMVSGNTSAFADDIDLSLWGPCDDGGVQSGGTGEGPDVIYEIVPSATCELRLTLTPTDGADLAIYATRMCDLLELLANWGTNGVGANIAKPANDIVDVFDLLDLLAAWGDC